MRFIRGIVGFCCINNPCKETLMKRLRAIWERGATASLPSYMHSSLFGFLYLRGFFSLSFFFPVVLRFSSYLIFNVKQKKKKICHWRKPLRDTEMTTKWQKKTKDANQLLKTPRMTVNGAELEANSDKINESCKQLQPSIKGMYKQVN